MKSEVLSSLMEVGVKELLAWANSSTRELRRERCSGALGWSGGRGRLFLYEGFLLVLFPYYHDWSLKKKNL